VRQDLASEHLNFAHRSLARGKAADQALELLQRWPDEAAVLYQVHRALLWDGRVEEAAAVLTRWQALTTEKDAWSSIPPGRQACAEGRRADAEAILAGTPEGDLSQLWHLLMLLGRTGEAAALLQPLEEAGNTFALASYLVYPQFDPSPFQSLMKILEREQVQRPPPEPLPFACPPAAAAP
jgi:thioredoxin-like negative regulator of GroEL